MVPEELFTKTKFMNLKKLLMAAIGSFVVMFVLSFVWHKLLMGSFYMQGDGTTRDVCHRAEAIIPLIAAAYAILAVIMAYIYPKGVEGDNKLMNGLRFGAVIGLLWIFPSQLVMHGVLNSFTLNVILVDSVWHMVEQGIGGIVIAYIYAS